MATLSSARWVKASRVLRRAGHPYVDAQAALESKGCFLVRCGGELRVLGRAGR